jgi:hypothetical protein
MRLVTTGVFCAAIAAAANTNGSQPTFYKDVLPVLEKNCQGCHRPGEAAPMSFLTFESTRPWAKSIKEAVLSKKMPPWFADGHYGKFANDRTLAAGDITTLVSWVDGGAKAGSPKDAPAPMDFVPGWRIGKPDKVFEMPEAFNVPASGTIDYQYIILPTGFTEDRYIQFAEARPGNTALVHHIIAFIREPGSNWLKDAKPGVPFSPKQQSESGGGSGRQQQAAFGDFLAGYAPGTIPQMLKPGQAKLVKAGSDIVLQMHYTANGKPGTDMTRVGVIFSKEAPAERVLTLAAVNQKLDIPPGDPNYQADAKITLYSDSTLIALLPHMHLRGKDFEYRVKYPSGETETLLSVPHYSFDWQLTYELAQPKLLPKGTVIECTAHWDNSANNPANPDPTKEVKFGEQSWDEMMFGFFDVSIPMKSNPVDLMRPPKKPAAATGAGE